jgi:hypothetical protein
MLLSLYRAGGCLSCEDKARGTGGRRPVSIFSAFGDSPRRERARSRSRSRSPRRADPGPGGAAIGLGAGVGAAAGARPSPQKVGVKEFMERKKIALSEAKEINAAFTQVEKEVCTWILALADHPDLAGLTVPEHVARTLLTVEKVKELAADVTNWTMDTIAEKEPIMQEACLLATFSNAEIGELNLVLKDLQLQQSKDAKKDASKTKHQVNAVVKLLQKSGFPPKIAKVVGQRLHGNETLAGPHADENEVARNLKSHR